MAGRCYVMLGLRGSSLVGGDPLRGSSTVGERVRRGQVSSRAASAGSRGRGAGVGRDSQQLAGTFQRKGKAVGGRRRVGGVGRGRGSCVGGAS